MPDAGPRQDRNGAVLLLLVAVAISALVLVLAATGSLRFVGSGDWLNFIPPQRRGWDSLWHPFSCFLVLAAVLFAFMRIERRLRRTTCAAAVALLACLAFALHLSTARVTPGGSGEAIMALAVPKTNVHYHNARNITSLADFLRTYDRRVSEAKLLTMRTHPPGPELFYFQLVSLYRSAPRLRASVLALWETAGFSRADLASPDVQRLFAGLHMDTAEVEVASCVAFTVQFLACLVVVPVYLLGAALRSRRTGLVAAGFAALIPSIHAFSPGLDQLYPVLAGTLGWLALVAVNSVGLRPRRGVAAALLFGLVLCGSMLFSLAFVVVAGLVVLVVIAVAWSARSRGLRHVAAASWPTVAAAAFGFAIPILLFAALWGVSLPGAWLRCLRENAAFNAASARPYLLSLLSNPAEFLVFLGVPLAVCFITAVFRARDGFRRAGPWAVGTLCLALVLLLLNLSGGNRGEVARLWMFLMPLCAVAAAAGTREDRSGSWQFWALLAAQFVQLVCFRTLLDVFSLYQG